MFKSVITTVSYFGDWKCEYLEEMLIPKVIGTVNKVYSNIRRLDRSLPIGHRVRGDVE